MERKSCPSVREERLIRAPKEESLELEVAAQRVYLALMKRACHPFPSSGKLTALNWPKGILGG